MKLMMTWLIRVVLAAVLGATVASGAVASQATPSATDGSEADIQAAADWLIGQQDESGGFSGFSGEPDVSMTIDAVIALVAAQLRGIDVGTSTEDAITFLESGDDALVYAQTGVGQAAKLVRGVVAYGGDPHDLAGVDPLILVEQGLSADTGFYGSGAYDHALALLALGAVGTEVPEEAIAILEETQTPEGGWAFDGSTAEGAADSNTTSVMVMALVAVGLGDSPAIGDALSYLQTTLVGTAGATFQQADGAMADANSTALVTQAVVAVGDDPAGEEWGNLYAALAGFQSDSGAFYYNETDPSDNLFSTAQAIPAAAGFALPLPSVPDAPATPSASLNPWLSERDLLRFA